MAISEIQDNIQKQNNDIKKIEKHINAIKDDIFIDFCEAIKVPNISYYEENNLRYKIFNLIYDFLFRCICKNV